MGYTDEEARQCLRFSFGWTTTAADGELAAELVKACL
jgi:cysteine sulfinate desulfinase/cysteine desulfurase-like protein